MKPLNGKKTHPLTEHAIGVLVRLSHGPQPRLTVNPGTVDRLLRGALVESVDLPSPYKSHHGQRIEHLRLTRAGHDAAMASHKTPNVGGNRLAPTQEQR